MARTRNSDNNAPATAAVGSSVARGRAKKEQVPQPKPATIPAQVVMPPEMEEAFNAVKGAMEMFTTFMANQGKREYQTPPHTGRRDGSMFSKNKKARTTGGFSSSIGGGNKGVPSKGSSVPTQSMPQTSGSLLGRHSQGNGSQSRQNQNFRTPVSQSQSE
ncbi:hypothetical protein HAX54_013036 [Datura stramonium]|uniref:Uncharacterized protein n=1 Tax=Datura stramonium TaxID=4076 RepID=A0ABS8TND8_DATST|nr:hypothetical protein [Datura stramonium]